MRWLWFLFFGFLATVHLSAQDSLVKKGIEFYSKGEYYQAIDMFLEVAVLA